MRILQVQPLAALLGNFAWGNIQRDKGARIVPYRWTKLIISRSAKVRLHGDLILNANCLQSNWRSTVLRLDEGAELEVNERFAVYYGGDIIVFSGGRLELGSGFINSDVKIRCKSSISIGRDVAISHDVTLQDYDGHYISEEEGRLGEGANCAPISIGDHVWIGTRVTVLKGVTIGDGAVISAGAVVTRDVPSGSLAGGVPARVIKKRVYWK